MTVTNDTQITILDGQLGSISAPLSSLQAVIGCCSSGTAAQVFPTSDQTALIAAFGYGPAVEAACLTIAAGGTVLFVKAASNAAGTTGAVTSVATGTSVVTAAGAANDDYLIKFLIVNGGTRGTTGTTFQVSLDAGRTYGPVLQLGTATTYLIPNTGVTLSFAAGTFVAGDYHTLGTVAPSWNTAGVQACMNALLASQYALSGWGGGTHIVGPCSGANASTIDGYFTTWATGFLYSYGIVAARDNGQAAKWSGISESEATWMTAIELDYSAVSAKRICANGGYWNMPSAIPNIAAGAPRYRRPLSFAAAARAVTVATQVSWGRVKDGSLSQIVIDPTNDPLDGFVYHDERLTPGLDATRFTSTMTRVGKPGVYIKNPNIMAPLGSDFARVYLRTVMDVACFAVHQKGQDFISDTVRLNENGTILEQDALFIEKTIKAAIDAVLTSKGAINASTVVVSRTQNVASTSIIVYTVTIRALGYILEEDVTIGFENPLAA